MKSPIVALVTHSSSTSERELKRPVESEKRQQASPNGVGRAIVLLADGLLTPEEFEAETALPIDKVPGLLDEPAVLAEVRRQRQELRTSGSLVRLEAIQHAREAVKVAAQIMGNEDLHPSNRLNAANFIAKAAGTERPAHEWVDPQHGKVKITINIGGDKRPLIIEADAVEPVVDTEEL